MEVFLALVACADHEHQLGRADVETQDVAGCAERDDEFAQRRPGATGIAWRPIEGGIPVNASLVPRQPWRMGISRK